MKKRCVIFLSLSVLALPVLIWSIQRTPKPPTSPQPNVEQVENLSQLTTVRVELADVQTSRIDGVTGSVEAVVLVKGDFSLTTDLSKARFETIDQQSRQAVLLLPQPQATPARLDHSRTRLVLVRENALWKVLPGDDAQVAVVNAVYRDAEQLLANASRDASYRDAARQQAEQILTAFFAGIGWRVTVRWDD